MSTVQLKIYNELEPLRNLGAAVTNEKDTLSKSLVIVGGYAYINNADMTAFFNTEIPFDIIVDYNRFVTIVQYMGDQELLMTYHEESGTLKIEDVPRSTSQTLNVTKPGNNTVFFDTSTFTHTRIEELAPDFIDSDESMAEFIAYLKDIKAIGTLYTTSTHAMAFDHTGRMSGDVEVAPYGRGWHVADFEGQYYIVSNGTNHQFGVSHPNKNMVLSKLIGTGLSGRVTATLLKIETPLSKIRFNDIVVIFEFMDNSVLVTTKLRSIVDADGLPTTDKNAAYLLDPVRVAKGLIKTPAQEEYATLETACTVDATVLGAVYLTILGFNEGGNLLATMSVNSQGIVTLTSENGSAKAAFDSKLRDIEPRKSEVILNWLKPLLVEGDLLHIGIKVITIFKPKGVVLLQIKPLV